MPEPTVPDGSAPAEAVPPAGSGPAPDWRARLRGSRLGTLAVLTLTTLLVMAGAYLINRPDPAAEGVTSVQLTGEQVGPAPKVGEPAQDFAATTVDGTRISLAGYRGKPVWLTFGASWCASCRAEAPDIQAAYGRAKAGGTVVLGVYLSEPAEQVRDFAGRLGLTYPQVADPQTRIASAYRVMGVPTHVFVDVKGVVRAIHVGVLTGERMDAALADIAAPTR